MANLKTFSECVALLADMVGSRGGDRAATHAGVLEAIALTNGAVPALDPLRVTVGDELQGVYASLGDALHARWRLSQELSGVAELRFGLGGGEVRVIDVERGIQDGSAWWLARSAVEQAEELAAEPGYRLVRTAIRDERPSAPPGADALVRLVETVTARLRPGSRRSLAGLLQGLDNSAVAQGEGISDSANSQRVINNDLRVLADAITALHALP